MTKLEEYKKYREELIKLMIAIRNETNLREEDMVLAIIQLDDTEKIIQFNEWVGSKLVNGKFTATAQEVMNETSRIGKIVM